MRLHNTIGGPFTRLRGPLGPIPVRLVHTRNDLAHARSTLLFTPVALITLTPFIGARCDALAAFLHLPALPGTGPLQQRRRQITDFLGVSLTD